MTRASQAGAEPMCPGLALGLGFSSNGREGLAQMCGSVLVPSGKDTATPGRSQLCLSLWPPEVGHSGERGAPRAGLQGHQEVALPGMGSSRVPHTAALDGPHLLTSCPLGPPALCPPPPGGLGQPLSWSRGRGRGSPSRKEAWLPTGGCTPEGGSEGTSAGCSKQAPGWDPWALWELSMRMGQVENLDSGGPAVWVSILHCLCPAPHHSLGPRRVQPGAGRRFPELMDPAAHGPGNAQEFTLTALSADRDPGCSTVPFLHPSGPLPGAQVLDPSLTSH